MFSTLNGVSLSQMRRDRIARTVLPQRKAVLGHEGARDRVSLSFSFLGGLEIGRTLVV